MTTASVSGLTVFSCCKTSMPFMPGMRRSRMAASKRVLASACTAARPSGHTVTSCPMRGSSERMNSWSDCSSSTNNTRRLLCGGCVANGDLLDECRGVGPTSWQWQADDKRAAVAGARAGRLDLAAVLADDALADRQSQPGALARAFCRKKRLEDLVQDLRRHA